VVMKPSGALSLLFVAALLPAGLAAQRVERARLQTWSPEIRVSSNIDRTSAAALRRDYRLEGLAVGGLLLGAVGVWIGSEACHNQPEPIGSGSGRSCTGDAAIVGLTGAVVGSGIGYLLGRGWPKRTQ